MTNTKLLKEFEKCAYFLKGTISDFCGNCHRATCICSVRTDKRSYRLTYKDKMQKTKMLYLPRDRVQEAKKLLTNYARLKTILERLLDANIETFKNST
jgi:hypothetical protein